MDHVVLEHDDRAAVARDAGHLAERRRGIRQAVEALRAEGEIENVLGEGQALGVSSMNSMRPSPSSAGASARRPARDKQARDRRRRRGHYARAARPASGIGPSSAGQIEDAVPRGEGQLADDALELRLEGALIGVEHWCVRGSSSDSRPRPTSAENVAVMSARNAIVTPPAVGQHPGASSGTSPGRDGSGCGENARARRAGHEGCARLLQEHILNPAAAPAVLAGSARGGVARGARGGRPAPSLAGVRTAAPVWSTSTKSHTTS